MFTVNFELPPEMETKLRERATRFDKPFDVFLREVVEKAMRWESMMELPPRQMSPEEAVAEWRAWVASRPVRPVIADDSRESIYEGRGE